MEDSGFFMWDIVISYRRRMGKMTRQPEIADKLCHFDTVRGVKKDKNSVLPPLILLFFTCNIY